MTWLWGLVTGLPGLLSKGLDYYIAKANGNVQKAIALMEADKVRLMAQRDVTLAAMNSRVWWMGWALFVFPLGIYYAKVIVWDKVLGWGVTDKLDGAVAEWSGIIVLSLFGMQVANSIINRVWK
jgi:hypothetical protein